MVLYLFNLFCSTIFHQLSIIAVCPNLSVVTILIIKRRKSYLVVSYACVLDMFDIEGSSFSRWCIGLEGQLCPYHCQQKDLTKSYLFFFFLLENPSKLKKVPCEHVLVAMMMHPLEAGFLPGEEWLTLWLILNLTYGWSTVCEFGFLFTRGCLDFLILDPFPASDILKPNRLPFLFIYLCLIEFFVSRLSSGMKWSCLTGYSGFWEEINGYWICSC